MTDKNPSWRGDTNINYSIGGSPIGSSAVGSTSSNQKGDEETSDDTPRDPEIMREIHMEEFQPTGTMTLALIYFVIIVLMWIFMYFFEFAGNDPSILG